MDEDDDAMVSYVSNNQTQEEKEMFDEAERQEKEALVRYKKNEKKKNASQKEVGEEGYGNTVATFARKVAVPI